MDIISEDKLKYIAGTKKLNLIYLEKDYFITLFLYLIRAIKGLYFKGGTALNKIFLDHTRLSEDLDFTTDKSISSIKAEIEDIVKKSKIFTKIDTGNITKEFIRYKIYYKSYFQREAFIILDINKKASVLLKPEKHKVPNFYNIDFSISTLSKREILAEKIRALITRNKPRDYFDAYFIFKAYTVDMALVKKKLKEAGEKFEKERVFKNARKIYSRWDELAKLTNKKLDFKECMILLKKKL
jgi:predicted nucleotidyltransferase component of viral defense system